VVDTFLPTVLVSEQPPTEEHPMPLYMDVHHLDGPVSANDVAKAHMADLQVQDKYEVNYQRYWVDEANSTIFCLVEAPSPDAAHTVHREAHGLVADSIHEVKEGS
jgi:Protein of unknown function (DUF4242)